MAKPLKSLITSCIGISCERNISGEEKMNNSDQCANINNDEILATSSACSQINYNSLPTNNLEKQLLPQSTPLHDPLSILHMNQQQGHINDTTHNILYANIMESNEVARNVETCSDIAPLHRTTNSGFQQNNDDSELLGFPPCDSFIDRMRSCISSDKQCNSEGNSNDWCSSCKVKIPIENECIQEELQRRLAQNKKSLWSFLRPKKTKQKDNKRNHVLLKHNDKINSNKSPVLDATKSEDNVGCAVCSIHQYRNGEFEYIPKNCRTQEIQGPENKEHNGTDGDSEAIIPTVDHVYTPTIFYPGFDFHIYLGRALRMEEVFMHNISTVPQKWHSQVNYAHCLVPDLLEITNCGFYWGKMDRYEAERLIENKPEGTFLLRDSAQEDYLFSVSFCRHERSLHARIEQSKGKFSFDPHDPGVFSSDTVCGLLEFYKDPSCCMFYDPVLTNPLPRTFPFPLQHLCRSTICSKITYNGINALSLPKTLKNYLKEYHYKQMVSVNHCD